MRRRGEQDQLALGIGGKALEQLEPLLAALMRSDAGVRLVDHDQRRARAREAVAAPLGLDVVEADDGVGMGVEQRLRGRQAALQARSRGGGDSDRVEIEFALELAGPLLDEMRRAQHGETVDLAAIDQLAQDQPGFDGLADADIVGDQQPHDGKAQRHQQRHELVGARLEAEPRRRAERPGAAPQRQPQRLGQQPGAVLGRGLRRRSATRTAPDGPARVRAPDGSAARPPRRPESGRRHSVSSSGEGSATHSRPRA